jgi:hypothetical protein
MISSAHTAHIHTSIRTSILDNRQVIIKGIVASALLLIQVMSHKLFARALKAGQDIANSLSKYSHVAKQDNPLSPDELTGFSLRNKFPSLNTYFQPLQRYFYSPQSSKILHSKQSEEDGKERHS